MTASLIISIVALVLISATCVAVTVLVSRALSSAFRTLDTMHKRSGEHLSSLLDRFQAIRWEDLASLRALAETGEEGGFVSPEEQRGEVTVEEPGRWGHLSRLSERLRLTEEEQAMLDEDFEMGETRRTE